MKTTPSQTIRKQIVERIKNLDRSNLNPLFITVSDSAELEDALKNNNVSEGCFVIKLERTATSLSEFYQKVTEHYQIVSICRNLSDANGQAVGELSEQMQQQIFKAISGFTPYDINALETNPMQFVSGGLIDLTNGLHIWADIYKVQYTQNINQQY